MSRPAPQVHVAGPRRSAAAARATDHAFAARAVAQPTETWLDGIDEVERTQIQPIDLPDDSPARRWYAIGAVAMVMVLAVFVTFMALGEGNRRADPAETPSAEPSASSNAGGSAGAGKDTAAPTPDPLNAPSSEATTMPTASAAPVVLDLGDAKVSVLPGWEKYADETVQDQRRLVRVRHQATDIRIQIVTLTSVTGDLGTACSDLVADQRQNHGSMVESSTVDVAVTGGSGAACSFSGVRSSDNVAVQVDFTLVRRDTDNTTLVFRDTLPKSVAANSPARAELVTIECGAVDSFGVKISQCVTPAQGDG